MGRVCSGRSAIPVLGLKRKNLPWAPLASPDFLTLTSWYNPLSLGPLLTADFTIRNGRIMG